MEEPSLAAGSAERLPFPVFHLDRDRRLLFASEAGARLFHRRAADLIGAPLDSLGDEGRDLDSAIRSVLHGDGQAAEWGPLAPPTESASLQEHRWVLYRDTDALGATTGLWLIAEKEASGDVDGGSALRRKLDEIRALDDALTRIDMLIHSVLEFDEIMRRVTVEAAKAVDAQSAIIFVPADSPGNWIARYTFGRLASVQNQTFTDAQLNASMLALQEHRAIVINDAPVSSMIDRYWVECHGVHALLDAGLFMADRPVGDIALYQHAPDRKFTEDQRLFIDKVGASVSVALQNSARFLQLREAEAERRENELRLRQQAEELEGIYARAPVGLAVLDRNLRFVRVNERLAELNGIPAVAHIGKTPRELLPGIAEAVEPMAKRVLTTGEPVLDFEFEGETPAQPGVRRSWMEQWFPLKDEQGEVWGVNVVVVDTTERRRLEERVRHMAEHDQLTDLPNRMLFRELLGAEMLMAERAGRRLALLFLDLDRFKSINDTLGHAAGDELLTQVAARLRSRVRRSDIVARLGGDEFTVLLPDLPNAEQVGETAQQLIQTFHAPFSVAGSVLNITTSIGISVFPDDAVDADVLLRHADLAMYEAKDRGRNTYRFYDAAVDHRAHERMQIHHALATALESDGIRVVYLPEVDLRSKRVIGVEALARWRHPELGVLDPQRFVPVAEESDLILALDETVLHTACAQARKWRDAGLPPIAVGVNLSARSFERADLLSMIRECLASNGIPGNCLEVEVTERTVMRDHGASLERMKAMADLGIRIAIDDFGTGYSSLSYLRRMPFLKVKIDQSFVSDVDSESDDRAIVAAVTALSHTLGKLVIAEGVENGRQLEFLETIDCDAAQGFHFSRPVPPEEVPSLVGRQGAAPLP